MVLTGAFPGMLISTTGTHFVPYSREFFFFFDLVLQPFRTSGEVISSVTTSCLKLGCHCQSIGRNASLKLGEESGIHQKHQLAGPAEDRE